MERGIIKNFKRSVNAIHPNQVVIILDNCKTKNMAETLRGKKAYWESTAGKRISGKVVDSHGNNGALKVKFSKGLPGTALGTKVFVY